jgi:hypothetical protein
MADF